MYKAKTWSPEQQVRRFAKKSSGMYPSEIVGVLKQFGFTVEKVPAFIPDDYGHYAYADSKEDAKAKRKEMLAKVTTDLTFVPGVDQVITKVGPAQDYGFQYYVANPGEAYAVTAPNGKTFSWNFRGTAKYQKEFWSWLETETDVFQVIETVEAPKTRTKVEGIEVDRSKTARSPKGLETLAQMGTKPEDWDFTPIKWVWRKELMPKKVWCPTCNGNGIVRTTDADSKSWSAYKKCPTCPTDKLRPNQGTGKVIEWNVEDVLVGIPDWFPGIRFDSRFAHCDCQLCAKSIYASGFVAVQAKDADGVPHGMYVGIDCARKFWGFKKFTDDGRVLEANLPKNPG